MSARGACSARKREKFACENRFSYYDNSGFSQQMEFRTTFIGSCHENILGRTLSITVELDIFFLRKNRPVVFTAVNLVTVDMTYVKGRQSLFKLKRNL